MASLGTPARALRHEIVSWGIVYYAFPVLNPQITAATGWPAGATTAVFSLALVISALAGIRVGRILDRRGPRAVMTIGSGLDTAADKGKHGGRPPVITDDMLHTVLRRRAGGESVEQIQPDLIIPTGKRKGQNPSVASIYWALAEHAKREAYPEAIAAAHDDFAAMNNGAVPEPALEQRP
ncbi:hypothetical protein [Streptomyces sp. NPDC012825]|uniref:hypothetical protein n=1 Tax=Streptomyces sp. NPDC012825 TaxID=3364851 RepID=UPI003682A670